jgi:branched-subunit amino acid ABC-type transport system permease component
MRDGLAYLREHPATIALLSIKAVWAVAGGMMLLLTVFGQRVFPTTPGQTAALGIGVLSYLIGSGSLLLVWPAMPAGLNELITFFATTSMAKVLVFALIVVFLQVRPAGLFPQKGRMVEA